MLILLAATLLVPAAQSAPAVDCTDADHRALDFWLGDWDVYDTASNARVAHSVISKDAGGCAVHERYDQDVGPGNARLDYHGRSYSIFDPRDGKWQQFYVDGGGYPRLLTGGFADGAMTFVGSRGNGRSRMVLRAQPDGSVRQSGEFSADGGTMWKPGYDFTYRRR